MFYKRLLQRTLQKTQKEYPAIVITGPRQSGKTELLKHHLADQNPTYLPLDDPNFRKLLTDNPLEFLKKQKPPVIIDEIQYLPELATTLKLLIDQDRKPGQWFLTGSQQFSVMKNISDSLAGRAAILTLPPFQLSERPQTNDLRDLIFNSSYPQLVSNPAIDSKIWYSSYLQTYLERDIRQLLNLENLRDFEQCLRLLASRTGQILDYSDIARHIGVSMPTVKRWVSALEASYILFLLPPYYQNFGKRIAKAPKIYFFDLGLVHYLTGNQTYEMTLQGPMAGAIFETAIISEIMKKEFATGIKPEAYFWHAHSGMEVDFILAQGGQFMPFEIKSSASVKPLFYENLIKWLELSRQKNVKGTLITNCADDIPTPSNIRHWYWKKALLNI